MQMALQEAWEEAGLIGILRQQPIGIYAYKKAGLSFRVVVYRMDVTTVLKDWPECERRSRYWLHPTEAVAHVRERGLRRLLLLGLAA